MMTKVEEIVKIIRERIGNETYTSRQRLPSEYQLAQEFDVSRLTIRKAISRLINAKILVKDPGKGTYVMLGAERNSKIESGRGGLQSFTEVAKEHGKTVHTKVLKFAPIRNPSRKISEILALDDRLDKKVFELKRIRYWDNDPMTLEKILICDEYIKNKTLADFEQSLFKILNENIEIGYAHQEIEAIMVTDEISKYLNIKGQQPIFKVKTITYTSDAIPIFFDTSFYRADKYSFKSTLTRLR